MLHQNNYGNTFNVSLVPQDRAYPSVSIIGVISKKDEYDKSWWYANDKGLCFKAHYLKLI